MSDQSDVPWWRRAIIVGLAGLLFSLAMSVAISLGAAFRIPPLVALERAGIDFGQKVYVAFAPWLDSSFKASPSHSYVFVDVDSAGCEAFAVDPGTCLADRPVPTVLVADFARAAASSGAKVVVIDIAPPDDPVQQGELLGALAKLGGPYLVVPLRARPAEFKGQVEMNAMAGGPWGIGRLRFALLSTATDPEAADGVIRHFPLLGLVRDQRSGTQRWLPTGPFLAAMLSDPTTASAVDCQFYPEVARNCSTPRPARFESTVAFGKDRGLRNRIQFTLPSMAAASPQEGARLRDRYLGRYDRYPASGLLTGGKFQIPDGTFQDRIVVLGSSMPQAHDWHSTPLGAMAGPEIVLNATRAFLEFSPLADTTRTAGPAQRLGLGLAGAMAKVSAVLVGSAVMTVGWLLIYGIGDRMRQRRRLGSLISIAIFLGGLTVLLAVEIFGGLEALGASATVPPAVDMLTPIAALGLEGFSEAARAFSQQAERLSRWTVDFIDERVRQWRNLLLRGGK